MRLFDRGEPAGGHVLYEVCDLTPLKWSERSVRSECIGRRVKEDKEDVALMYSSERVLELPDDKDDVAVDSEPPENTDGVVDGIETSDNTDGVADDVGAPENTDGVADGIEASDKTDGVTDGIETPVITSSKSHLVLSVRHSTVSWSHGCHSSLSFSATVCTILLKLLCSINL